MKKIAIPEIITDATLPDFHAIASYAAFIMKMIVGIGPRKPLQKGSHCLSGNSNSVGTGLEGSHIGGALVCIYGGCLAHRPS